MPEEPLTHARLKELLQYNPDTGIWIRLKSAGGRAAGTIAGSTGPNGYRIISVDDKQYYEHRLAWFYIHGKWPEHLIDHKNGHVSKADNKLDNLRKSTKSQNTMNSKLRSDNTSGYRGVYWREPLKKWFVQITKNGKTHSLGVFSEYEKAVEARIDAETKLFGEFRFKEC